MKVGGSIHYFTSTERCIIHCIYINYTLRGKQVFKRDRVGMEAGYGHFVCSFWRLMEGDKTNKLRKYSTYTLTDFRFVKIKLGDFNHFDLTTLNAINCRKICQEDIL